LTSDTCVYLDTNIVIANIDEKDPNHNNVVKQLGGITSRRLVSRLTLVELATVYTRPDLENPVALAMYSVEKAGASIARVDFNEVLEKAVLHAERLRLRTLDLLHVVLSNILGCKVFFTLDTDIINKSEKIKEELDITVVTTESPAFQGGDEI
jgi:predicted nucleic acid-binding protein